MGWSTRDGGATAPPGELGVAKAGLGGARGQAAVHDLRLSVCPSSLPAGAAFARPFLLVAAEVHAHLPPVPPAQQPPGQGSPLPHRQEALRQHLRFPVSSQGTAAGGGSPPGGRCGADVGLAFPSGSHIENWHSILRNGLVNASYTKLQVTGCPAAPRQAGRQAGMEAAAGAGLRHRARALGVAPRRSPWCFPASCTEQPMARASI